MKILVAIDGKNSTGDVIETAAHWASQDDDVHVIHVVDPQEAQPTFSSDGLHRYAESRPPIPPTSAPVPAESSLQATQRALDEHKQRIRSALADHAGTDSWTVHVDIDGNPVQSISRAATELHADVIVIGKRNRPRLAAVLLGSVAAKLANETSIPVLLAPEGFVPRTVAQGDAQRAADVLGPA